MKVFSINFDGLDTTGTAVVFAPNKPIATELLRKKLAECKFEPTGFCEEDIEELDTETQAAYIVNNGAY
jgi:hypothetical protein